MIPHLLFQLTSGTLVPAPSPDVTYVTVPEDDQTISVEAEGRWIAVPAPISSVRVRPKP